MMKLKQDTVKPAHKVRNGCGARYYYLHASVRGIGLKSLRILNEYVSPPALVEAIALVHNSLVVRNPNASVCIANKPKLVRENSDAFELYRSNNLTAEIGEAIHVVIPLHVDGIDFDETISIAPLERSAIELLLSEWLYCSPSNVVLTSILPRVPPVYFSPSPTAEAIIACAELWHSPRYNSVELLTTDGGSVHIHRDDSVTSIVMRHDLSLSLAANPVEYLNRRRVSAAIAHAANARGDAVRFIAEDGKPLNDVYFDVIELGKTDHTVILQPCSTHEMGIVCASVREADSNKLLAVMHVLYGGVARLGESVTSLFDVSNVITCPIRSLSACEGI